MLTVSALRTMLAVWGEERCLLVVSQAAAPLAACEFPRTPRVVLPDLAPSLTRHLVPAWWRERRQFRGIACERVVCLSHHRDLYKQVVLSWIATDRLHLLERATYPTVHAEGWCLELVAHQRLAEAALGRALASDEVLPRLTSIQATDGETLVVCPLASEPIRRVPESVLVPALARWRNRSRAPITLSGPSGAAAELARLAATLHAAAPGPIEVAAGDSFGEFLARLARAGAVLAAESGPGHLATALDKRAVIAVGGGLHGLCAPWRRSARQTIAEHATPCYHCGWHCTQPGVPCLSGVDPAAIADALPTL